MSAGTDATKVERAVHYMTEAREVLVSTGAEIADQRTLDAAICVLMKQGGRLRKRAIAQRLSAEAEAARYKGAARVGGLS